LESAEGILITAAIRNITVRKDAEKHLEQMEGRYRGLLEAAPDGMVVVNQAGEIVLLNAQAEKQFGYRRDELLGQKVTNIIPTGFAERLIADGTRTAAEALAQQIGTGIELNGKRKDGSEFPIEIMLSPLESTEGILVTAAIRDITVRRRHAHAGPDPGSVGVLACRNGWQSARRDFQRKCLASRAHQPASNHRGERRGGNSQRPAGHRHRRWPIGSGISEPRRQRH
jgi:PAS domain S-box-containing protein